MPMGPGEIGPQGPIKVPVIVVSGLSIGGGSPSAGSGSSAPGFTPGSSNPGGGQTFNPIVPLTGSGPPGATIGVSGQFYVDISASPANLYLNNGGTWVNVANSLSTLANFNNKLSADVALALSTFADGPSVNVGATGTFFCSGEVGLLDTGAAATFNAKLWDGTTIMASAAAHPTAANQPGFISLSGIITNPAGNIKISVENVTTATGLIKAANAAGGNTASQLTAVRIG